MKTSVGENGVANLYWSPADIILQHEERVLHMVKKDGELRHKVKLRPYSNGKVFFHKRTNGFGIWRTLSPYNTKKYRGWYFVSFDLHHYVTGIQDKEESQEAFRRMVHEGTFVPWGKEIPDMKWTSNGVNILPIPTNLRRPPRTRGSHRIEENGVVRDNLFHVPKIAPKDTLPEVYEGPEQLQPNGFLVDMDDDNLAVLSFPLIDEIYELLGRPNIGKMKAVMTVVAQACGYRDWEDAMAKATNDDGHLTKRYIISMGQKGSVKFLPK